MLASRRSRARSPQKPPRIPESPAHCRPWRAHAGWRMRRCAKTVMRATTRQLSGATAARRVRRGTPPDACGARGSVLCDLPAEVLLQADPPVVARGPLQLLLVAAFLEELLPGRPRPTKINADRSLNVFSSPRLLCSCTHVWGPHSSPTEAGMRRVRGGLNNATPDQAARCTPRRSHGGNADVPGGSTAAGATISGPMAPAHPGSSSEG